MSWRLVVRPEAGEDVLAAAAWYDEHEPGLGQEFVEEVINVFDALADNPLLGSRRHTGKNIRWRYTDRFPYRIVYEVIEQESTVVVATVLHAARHEQEWRKRV